MLKCYNLVIIVFLNKQCFVSYKFKKYSEYIKLKHFCFFSCSVYFINMSCLFHAHEKLNHDKKSVLKKHQKLSICLTELNAKMLCLKCHQCFLRKHDDKLIQKSMKIFKKKLCVLKKK